MQCTQPYTVGRIIQQSRPIKTSDKGVVEKKEDNGVYIISLHKNKIKIKLASGELNEGDHVRIKKNNNQILIEKVLEQPAKGSVKENKDLANLNSSVDSNVLKEIADAISEHIKIKVVDKKTLELIQKLIEALAKNPDNFSKEIQQTIAELKLTAAKIAQDGNKDISFAKDIADRIIQLTKRLIGQVKNSSGVNVILTKESAPFEGYYFFDDIKKALEWVVKYKQIDEDIPWSKLDLLFKDKPVIVKIFQTPWQDKAASFIPLDKFKTELEVFFNSNLNSKYLKNISSDVIFDLILQKEHISFERLQKLDLILSELEKNPQTQNELEKNIYSQFSAKDSNLLKGFIEQWLAVALEENSPLKALAERFPSSNLASYIAESAEKIFLMNTSNKQDFIDNVSQNDIIINEQALNNNAASDKIIIEYFKRIGLNFESTMLKEENIAAEDIKTKNLKAALLSLLNKIELVSQNASATLSAPLQNPDLKIKNESEIKMLFEIMKNIKEKLTNILEENNTAIIEKLNFINSKINEVAKETLDFSNLKYQQNNKILLDSFNSEYLIKTNSLLNKIADEINLLSKEILNQIVNGTKNIFEPEVTPLYYNREILSKEILKNINEYLQKNIDLLSNWEKEINLSIKRSYEGIQKELLYDNKKIPEQQPILQEQNRAENIKRIIENYFLLLKNQINLKSQTLLNEIDANFAKINNYLLFLNSPNITLKSLNGIKDIGNADYVKNNLNTSFNEILNINNSIAQEQEKIAAQNIEMRKILNELLNSLNSAFKFIESAKDNEIVKQAERILSQIKYFIENTNQLEIINKEQIRNLRDNSFEIVRLLNETNAQFTNFTQKAELPYELLEKILKQIKDIFTSSVSNSNIAIQKQDNLILNLSNLLKDISKEMQVVFEHLENKNVVKLFKEQLSQIENIINVISKFLNSLKDINSNVLENKIVQINNLLNNPETIANKPSQFIFTQNKTFDFLSAINYSDALAKIEQLDNNQNIPFISQIKNSIKMAITILESIDNNFLQKIVKDAIISLDKINDMVINQEKQIFLQDSQNKLENLVRSDLKFNDSVNIFFKNLESIINNAKLSIENNYKVLIGEMSKLYEEISGNISTLENSDFLNNKLKSIVDSSFDKFKSLVLESQNNLSKALSALSKEINQNKNANSNIAVALKTTKPEFMSLNAENKEKALLILKNINSYINEVISSLGNIKQNLPQEVFGILKALNNEIEKQIINLLSDIISSEKTKTSINELSDKINNIITDYVKQLNQKFNDIGENIKSLSKNIMNFRDILSAEIIKNIQDLPKKFGIDLNIKEDLLKLELLFKDVNEFILKNSKDITNKIENLFIQNLKDLQQTTNVSETDISRNFIENIRQNINNAINKIESLQILAKQVSFQDGQQQIICLPMKIDEQFTEVVFKFLKKNKGHQKTGDKKNYQIVINVSPSRLGEINVKMDYNEKKHLNMNMEFEKEESRNFFLANLQKLIEAMEKHGIKTVSINMLPSLQNQKINDTQGIVTGSSERIDIKA
jgi:hypothetical protein